MGCYSTQLDAVVFSLIATHACLSKDNRCQLGVSGYIGVPFAALRIDVPNHTSIYVWLMGACAYVVKSLVFFPVPEASLSIRNKRDIRLSAVGAGGLLQTFRMNT